MAAAVVLLLASLPALAGWAAPRADREFSGLVMHLPDGFSYLAKMRLGADGAWLFTNVYAVEAHPTVLLYLPYLLLGKLSGPQPEAILAMFHLARVVFGGLLLIVVYRFVAMLLEDVWQRRLAWLLIAAGGGLGWLLTLVTQEPLPLGNPPLDLYLGEAFTFIVLMASPHAALARSALRVGVILFAQAVKRGSRRSAAGAGAAWLLATISMPFDILVAGGAVAGMLCAQAVRTRRFPWRAAGLGIMAGLPGAVWLMIMFLMVGDDPAYASWTAQNSLPRPNLLHFVSAFGVLAGLAILGARRACFERRAYADLFIGWALASPLLTLIPVGVQLRLIEAFAVPLSALAVLALDRFGSRPVARRLAGVAFLAVLLPSTLLLSLGGAAEAAAGSPRVFLSGDELAGYSWLAAQAPVESVLLSSDRVGLIAPTRARIRSVLGHGFETPYYERKLAEAAAFYGGSFTDAERRDLLNKYDVRYVWWGPDEQALGPVDPGSMPDLTPVFAKGRVIVYEVGP
jgi:hypothetical protein